jgi:hypothetical protein
LLALHARDARWKLVVPLADVDSERLTPDGPSALPWRLARGEPQLFDLDADPNERRDLASEPARADTVERLRAAALRWWHESGGGEFPR